MKSAAVLLLVLTVLLGDVFTNQSSIATLGAWRLPQASHARATGPLGGL